jgi:antitoxin HicB
MFMFEYAVTLTPDPDGGFVVTAPDFPEVVSQGETVEECLEQAADAIEEAVAHRILKGLELPEPGAVHGEHVVAVPASTALKAALYKSIRGLNMSKVQVAALLGVDEKEVRRLLDPRHPSKLVRIEELMKRMDRRIVIGLDVPPSEAGSVTIPSPEGLVWETRRKPQRNLYEMPARQYPRTAIKSAAPDEIAS